MKIKMNCSLSGPGTFLARANIYDLPTERAEELILAKIAVTVSSDNLPAATQASKRDRAVRAPDELR